ncbi:MAG: Na+ dependent nucleoside transporter [Saprospiraceae bacterium]|nr:Na+ dependent nucleoside transporter [Saprospiraceae bacterium]
MAENIARGLLGLLFLLGVCFALSNSKKNIDWRLVGGGILLQFVLALGILKVPFIYQFFDFLSDAFVSLLKFADEGAAFVFGNWPDAAEIQQTVQDSSGSFVKEPFTIGYMFAFKVLPTVVFFSAFSAMLYYFGILQKIIYAFAWVMSKFMKLSGAESIAAAANVFIGQTEAPLVVKPYLEKMTRSEIACLMVGGFATIAGGVFALFVSLIGADYAIHFLTASIISAPAAIVAAKMIVPEKNPEAINRSVKVPKDKLGNNVLDAIAIGTTDGVRLAVNVGAMLLVFIAMVAFLNGILLWIGNISGLNDIIAANSGFSGLSIEYILGNLFAPLAWIIGTPWEESAVVGQLLGKKMTINEVVAYVDLQKYMSAESGVELSQKSKIIATYALCGFANFASIGIQIGGISALASSQRKNLTELGFKAMIGGTIAALMTATIAGMLLG